MSVIYEIILSQTVRISAAGVFSKAGGESEPLEQSDTSEHGRSHRSTESSQDGPFLGKE